MGALKLIDDEEEVVLCPHCYAKNPVRAYICLTCFKLLNPPIKVPFWRQAFRGSRPVLLFVILFCLSSIMLIRSWLSRVENHLTTIQAENQKYQESMTSYIKGRLDQLEIEE